MGFLKRFGLSSGAAFVILMSYTFALKLPSQVTLEVFFAIMGGGAVCCAVAGLFSALAFRKNLIVMLIVAQVISIAITGVVWRM